MWGAIADDITGAVDLASNFVSRGFRTRLHFGVPVEHLDASETDVVIVALKSRTAPVADAIRDSRAALDALRSAGADRIYVKYCSTFDSTPRGNIGPVCDAIIDEMDAGCTVVVPSFPDNKRTVYRGHLFVGDRLLSESSLVHHPLTPMTDPDIVRVLGRQTEADVALVGIDVVREGADAVRTAIAALDARGVRFAVVDAIDDSDLETIATATAAAPVVTGGSGLALGMPLLAQAAAAATPDEARRGPSVVLAGSASVSTRAQIAHAAASDVPVLRLDVDDLSAAVPGALANAAALFASDPDATVVIAPATSATPVDATAEQGAARAAALEAAFGRLARAFVDRGIRRLLIAGGETSGAVVGSLGIVDLLLGETISPGVAWTFASVGTPTGHADVALALKSGNFGRDDFFLDAWRHLT